MDLNPRNLRERLLPHVGKRVVIGTTNWHYVSGTLESIAKNGNVTVRVASDTVVIPPEMIATFTEAPVGQAEYVK